MPQVSATVFIQVIVGTTESYIQPVFHSLFNIKADILKAFEYTH